MASKHQLAKIEFVKVWVTRLPSLSHPPLSMWRHRVTCLPPKNASAPWGGSGSRWLTIIVRQVSYIQYLPACKKSQRSTPYNIIKSVLAWSRVFRRRHLGRRVTAVTCLRWPTVTGFMLVWYIYICNMPDPARNQIHIKLAAPAPFQSGDTNVTFLYISRLVNIKYIYDHAMWFLMLKDGKTRFILYHILYKPACINVAVGNLILVQAIYWHKLKGTQL